MMRDDLPPIVEPKPRPRDIWIATAMVTAAFGTLLLLTLISPWLR